MIPIGGGEARLERFQKKIRGRLKTWKEDEHRADGALRELKPGPAKRS